MNFTPFDPEPWVIYFFLLAGMPYNNFKADFWDRWFLTSNIWRLLFDINQSSLKRVAGHAVDEFNKLLLFMLKIYFRIFTLFLQGRLAQINSETTYTEVTSLLPTNVDTKLHKFYSLITMPVKRIKRCLNF